MLDNAKHQNCRWYFNKQIIRNLCWFIIYKITSFACPYRSYERFKKYISICRQAHYLTLEFLVTGRPCIRIRFFFLICQYTLIDGKSKNMRESWIGVGRYVKWILNVFRYLLQGYNIALIKYCNSMCVLNKMCNVLYIMFKQTCLRKHVCLPGIC